MNLEEYYKKIEQYAKESLKNDKSGHDYTHAKRVLRNALKISKSYPEVDKEVLIVACWLHDISYKRGVVKDHHLVGAKDSKKFLITLGFPEDKIAKVVRVIEDHVGNTSESIKRDEKLQIESKIVRDADNLDALGEEGIERAIKFNQSINRQEIVSLKDVFNDSLYGSLKEIVTWAGKMLTPEGRKMAQDRVDVMNVFLNKLEEKIK